VGHDLGAPRRVPGADQLGIRQVLRQPYPALTEGYRMGEHAAYTGERRPRQCHDGVVNRVKDLVRQMECAIAEGLVKEVVGGRDRPDEGVLDRETAGLGAALANSSHNVLDVPARQRFELGPATARGGFTERPVRALNGDTHEHTPLPKKKKPHR
jgi:hypothetical protein